MVERASERLEEEQWRLEGFRWVSFPWIEHLPHEKRGELCGPVRETQGRISETWRSAECTSRIQELVEDTVQDILHFGNRHVT